MDQNDWLYKVLIPIGIALLGWFVKLLWNAAIDAMKRYVNRELDKRMDDIENRLGKAESDISGCRGTQDRFGDRLDKLIDRLITRNS